jgi:nucleolar protein 56
MPPRLVTTWYGTFLIGEDREVLASALFPKAAEEIAERLEAIRSGELLVEEHTVAPKEGDFGVLEDRQLSLPGATLHEEAASASAPPPPQELGFALELLRDAALAHAAKAVREALPPDQPVMLYLRAMDHLEREASRGLELLRYWHSFHFPELAALVDERTFLDLLMLSANREDILAERPDLDPGTEPGRPLAPGEGQGMSNLAANIVQCRRTEEAMRTLLEEAIRATAPNVAVVAGPIVGARLVNLAGSLERLSRMPSSTIQLLGAERALFLHIKEGAPAPKHGVIFQHPSVHSSPPWLRGRVARSLAGKISIATRADAVGTHPEGDLGRELRDAFLERAKRLRAEHPEPPPGWKKRRIPVSGKGRGTRGRRAKERGRKGGRRGGGPRKRGGRR